MIHDEAERYARKAYTQADAHVSAAVQRAEDLSTEAESIVAKAKQRSQEEMRSARAYCEHLVSTTVSRASAITRDTDDLINSMTMDAETQISGLRRQQHMLDQYVQWMRSLARLRGWGTCRSRAVRTTGPAHHQRLASSELRPGSSFSRTDSAQLNG